MQKKKKNVCQIRSYQAFALQVVHNDFRHNLIIEATNFKDSTTRATAGI